MAETKKEAKNKESKTKETKVKEKVSPTKTADSAKKVMVEYEGRFEDGTIFDSSSKHGRPLEFELGRGQVIKGFEDAVKKLKKGQETEIKIRPEEAYGMTRSDLVREIQRSQLPPGHEVKEGMMLLVSLPNGAQIPARITEVNISTVKIDLNHPLAGKTLIFKIKLV